MALFTKLFDHDFHPYELKGRWYKITVDTAGNVTQSDIPGVTYANNVTTIPSGYVVTHYVLIPVNLLTNSSVQSAITRYRDGSFAVNTYAQYATETIVYVYCLKG